MFDINNASIDFRDITNTGGFSDLANDFDNAIAIDSVDPLIALEGEALAAFKQAVADIKEIRVRRICQLSISLGKDSTLLLLAGLEAHKQLVRECRIAKNAVFVCVTIDTGIENHLIQILVHEEVQKLRAHCHANNINLDMRFATPPLSKKWASLFLSGHKMLSTSKLNSDCSIILKINSAERVERSIKEAYGDVVILVGSRLDESVARKNSLVKHKQNARDVHDFLTELDSGKGENVFAPISHITTEQVWLLLRRAGKKPIIKPSSQNFSLSSYADNHLLLAVVYGDSSDGTCPTTSKKIKGQSAGGCGNSSRTGCSLCLRVKRESSGEAQNKSARHSVISKNMLNVRNYMAVVAEDLSKRSWHTRAIDKTTGAIAAYPNVLNAQTIDELIKLLIQCTVDDVIRAKQFKLRVLAGDEALDKGYADILADTTLTTAERDVFADVYKRHAQEVLHKPMSQEIAMYLSFVHSRDGMKLPPNRAIALWKTLHDDFLDAIDERMSEEYAQGRYINLEDAHAMVTSEYESKGIRMPYPVVDVMDAVHDEVPDAVMILPTESLADYDYVPHTGIFNAEDVVGCMVDVEHDKITLPLTQANKILPSIHDVEASSVQLRGFVMDESFNVFRDKAKVVAIKKEISKRPNKRVSRKKGQFKVIEKGRTSVGSHSFSERTLDTVLTSRLTSNITMPKLSLAPSFIPLNEANDDVIGTYAISMEGYYNWIDYGGFEKAIEDHDEFVADKLKRGESIYYWPGVRVVESMQRYGLFDLSPTAIKSSMHNLKRTAYFGSMGLFKLNDEDFIELASLTSSSDGYTDTIKKFSHLYVKSIMTMPDYRAFKAKQLVNIRQSRNAERVSLKKRYASFKANELAHDLSMSERYFTDLFADFESQIETYLNTRSVSVYGFEAIKGYAKFLSCALTDEVYFSRFLSSKTKAKIKRNLSAKKQAMKLRKRLHTALKSILSLDSFTVEWQDFEKEQMSIQEKPVEFETNIIW